MKTLSFARPNDLSKLHDELLLAVPTLRPIDQQSVVVVEGSGDDIWITVPDGTDESAIAAVLTAHDPTPTPAPIDPDAAFEVALRNIQAGVEAVTDDAVRTVLSDLVAGLIERHRKPKGSGRRT